MKKKPFSNFLKMTAIFMMMAVVVASCKKDDDPKPDPEPLVEDGIYVVGAGTALTTFDIKGLMKSTKNEVDQSDRAALLELFIPVKAGAEGFNIVKVAGSTKTTYGPGADFAAVTEFQTDEPSGKFSRGSIAETTTKFTVAEDGLYHVVYDTELGKVVVAKAEWGLIGGATPGGWGSNTEMPVTFDLNKMEFTKTEVTLLQNDFKFRYTNGWKIFIDAEGTVKVNTNLGGTLVALVPGGDNIANAEYYKINEISTTPVPGFAVGIVGNLRLANHFDLRFVPTLAFGDRFVDYKVLALSSNQIKLDIIAISKSIPSTTVDFPFHIKYRSKRLNNFAAYVIVGAKYSIEMASTKKVSSANNNVPVKINRNDFMAETGVGFDFYTPYFKFGTELKMSYGLKNILVKDDFMYSQVLDRLNNKVFQLSFTFE